MTVRELREWLDYIVEDINTLDDQIVLEPPSEWRNYHMSPGFSRRYQHGKPPVIVWRLE